MKLKRNGINGQAIDYIRKHRWSLFNKTNNKTGFDIFNDVTSWPKFFSTHKLTDKSPPQEIYNNSIVTNMILRDNEKILLEHGRCLSYDPSRKKVQLSALEVVYFVVLRFTW